MHAIRLHVLETQLDIQCMLAGLLISKYRVKYRRYFFSIDRVIADTTRNIDIKLPIFCDG